MKKHSVLWLIVVILCFSITVIAKEKKTSASIKKKAAREKTEDTSPIITFDINAEKLPPNYKGTDLGNTEAQQCTQN